VPRFTITDAFIAKLKPPASGNKVFFADIPGFGVRISSGGAIAFVYNYRFHGEQRRMKIGSYPAFTPFQARAAALKLQHHVESGIDPLQEKRAASEAPTLADLAKEYRNDPDVKKKRASTLRNEAQMLDSIILPKLGGKKVAALTRADIAKLHSSLSATPYRANRVLALISILLSFAIEMGYRSDNPATLVTKFPEEKRNRWLTEEEMQRLVDAIDDYHDQHAANAIRLLLLTGAREGEVLNATWEEFDLNRGAWTKPTHHTKQKRTEVIPLSDAALELLRSMNKSRSGTHVFPGNGTNKARVTIRRPWVQVCKAAGLTEVVTVKGKRQELKRYKPTLRIHDLRHNFASHLVSSGASLHIVGKLLGHTQPQTTARYAHLADNPLREAANKFGALAAKSSQ
jgi:integrase